MKITTLISTGFALISFATFPALAGTPSGAGIDVARDVAPEREPSSMQQRQIDDEASREKDRRILERGPITHGQYITGGVIGSIFGLGIGHAIQHRYGEKGWIFTTSGVVGLGLYIGGVASCTKKNTDSNNNSSYSLDCSSGAATAIAAGAIIDVGFHIWEIIDLWVAPPRINRRYNELRGNPPSALETARLLPVAMTATNHPNNSSSVAVVPGLGLSMQF